MSKELTLQTSDHTWHVVVHQMTLRMSLAASRMSEEAAKQTFSDTAEKVMKVYFYPIMAACTTCEAGPIPTVEEFLDLLNESANSWFTAIRELNPEALPETLGGASEEPSEEKKDSSPTSSLPGSETS